MKDVHCSHAICIYHSYIILFQLIYSTTHIHNWFTDLHSCITFFCTSKNHPASLSEQQHINVINWLHYACNLLNLCKTQQPTQQTTRTTQKHSIKQPNSVELTILVLDFMFFVWGKPLDYFPIIFWTWSKANVTTRLLHLKCSISALLVQQHDLWLARFQSQDLDLTTFAVFLRLKMIVVLPFFFLICIHNPCSRFMLLLHVAVGSQGNDLMQYCKFELQLEE